MHLLIPAKLDPERDAVAQAWRKQFGSVVRLERFWDIPDTIQGVSSTVYGHDTFCLVVAQKLGLNLLTPDDRLIAYAPHHVVHRSIRLVTLSVAFSEDFPAFVKPAVPKQFRGAVYSSPDDLRQETQGLPASTEVLRSDIVTLHAEARAFLLDGAVRACSIYEGLGDVRQAADHAHAVVAALDLPRSCVVDVGLLSNGEWALIELNSTWGAGLNGCVAEDVIECIAAATISPPE